MRKRKVQDSVNVVIRSLTETLVTFVEDIVRFLLKKNLLQISMLSSGVLVMNQDLSWLKIGDI